jgi:hypothetical protein
MATQYSDQAALYASPTAGAKPKKHPSEKYGAVRSFNITLNASGSYPTGVTPANVTYNSGDVVRLITVKSCDKVRSIKLLDANGIAGVSFNVGLLYGVVSGDLISPLPAEGSVANATAYASGDADVDAAHLQPVELAYLNRLPGACNQWVWEDAGLSSDPGGTMIIALTITNGTMTVSPDQVAFLIDVVNL